MVGDTDNWSYYASTNFIAVYITVQYVSPGMVCRLPSSTLESTSCQPLLSWTRQLPPSTCWWCNTSTAATGSVLVKEIWSKLYNIDLVQFPEWPDHSLHVLTMQYIQCRRGSVCSTRLRDPLLDLPCCNTRVPSPVGSLSWGSSQCCSRT